MVCNKITFVCVLVGLISISCMVSSAALGDDPAPSTTEAPTTAAKTSTEKATTPSDDPSSTTPKVDPSSTTPKVDPSSTTPKVDPSASPTQKYNGAGCPKITYGML